MYFASTAVCHVPVSTSSFTFTSLSHVCTTTMANPQNLAMMFLIRTLVYLSINSVTEHRLQISQGQCFASVAILTIDSHFTSVVDFVVIPHLDYDMILGMDWIGLCCTISADGLTVFPLHQQNLF